MIVKKLLSLLLGSVMACSVVTSFSGCEELDFLNNESIGIVDPEIESIASTATPLSYSTGVNKDGKYDNSLFYNNDFSIFSTGADPSMFYYEGYYYVYTTSGGLPLVCHRTKNFADWEYMGVAYDFATAYKNGETWARSLYWAPEAFEWNGKFYMYVTVNNTHCPESYPEGLEELAAWVTEELEAGKSVSDSNITQKSQELYGVALNPVQFLVSNILLVADEPQGPYEQWTGERTVQKYYHGEKIGQRAVETVTAETSPFFDFANVPAVWETNKYLFETPVEERDAYEQANGKRIWEMNGFPNLDGMLFEEEDGDLYYYVVRSGDGANAGQSIWGCKMFNPWTPDYSTFTKLVTPRRLTIDGEYTYGDNKTEGTMDGGINEGVFMLKHQTIKPDGGKTEKYYLTYSTGKKADTNDWGYNIAVAIGDSPLGPFTKLDKKYGNPIYMVSGAYGSLPSSSWTHGSGHGTFCTVEDETFLIAHSTQVNASTGVGNERMPIIDRLTWAYNEELGYDLPHMNGPSKQTLQPQPFTATGYKNVAPLASVTATNVVDKESVRYINDDYRVIHPIDEHKQFHTKIGGSTITLTFDQPTDIRAIMIYNSYDIKFAFSKIDYILFENGTDTKIIRDLDYPESGLTNKVLEASSIKPGGAAVAEFDEKQVTKISIKVTQKFSVYEDAIVEGVAYDPTMYGISISDIVVLGKDGKGEEVFTAPDTVEEESFNGSNAIDISNKDAETGETIVYDRNLFDVSGSRCPAYYYQYTESGSVKLNKNLNVPFKNDSRTGNGFVATITSKASVYNRSWNNGGIAMYTGSEGKTNLQFKIFVVSGVNEVRIFFVHFGAPWAERSYSIPYEGYEESDNGREHSLTVVFEDGVFYVGFAKAGDEMRYIKIDKNTPYNVTYKNGVPRNADVSAIFLTNDKVLGLATTDANVEFTKISYDCSKAAVNEAIENISASISSYTPNNGKIIYEEREYFVGDTVTFVLKARDGFELSKLLLNGNVIDISDIIGVGKTGGITEYVYELKIVKAGSYTISAEFSPKEIE